MRGAFAIAALVALLAGCGGSDGDDSTATMSASEVEASVKAQLANGGQPGVVNLDTDKPKRVTCTKDAASANGWRCTVETVSGRSMLCIVQPQSGAKVPATPVCGPTDN
jgi:hypothetical protein